MNIGNFKILTRFTNETDGLESYVTTTGLNFAVVLKDTDANKFVGPAKPFDNEADAEAYALDLVDTDAPKDCSYWV